MTGNRGGKSMRPGPWRVWLPTIAWFAMICVMSSSNFSAAHTFAVLREFFAATGITWSPRLVNMILRKVTHFSLYAIFFLILTDGPLKGRPFAALLVCVITGSMDEIHQRFLLERTSSAFDVGIDTAGAFFGFFLRLFWNDSSDSGWRPIELDDDAVRVRAPGTRA